MKRQKKLRKLKVDGYEYYWLIHRLDEAYVLLKIWHASSRKNNQYINVKIRFDDPWLNYGPIVTAPRDKVYEIFVLRPVTPRIVRRIVEEALIMGWRFDEKGKPLRFTWKDDEGLSLTSNYD